MRLPPALPTCPNMTAILPETLPAPLRKRVEALAAAWSKALEDRDAAVAEAVKLSNPGTLPLDASGADVLKALDGATRKASAAAVQVLQCNRQAAAVFAEVTPFADAAAVAAETHWREVQGAVATSIRKGEPLLSDADLRRRMEGHADVAAAYGIFQTAEHHRDRCQKIGAVLATGHLGRWFREACAAEVLTVD